MADNNEQKTPELSLESLAKQLQDQQQLLSKLQQENTQLKGKLLKKEEKKPAKPTLPKDPVEVDGRKYAFRLVKFTLPGDEPVTLTAQEAATDEDVLKRILAIEGQGILKELV